MGKKLVVAEKPSVARDLAKVLGCNKKGNNCIIGDDYIVTWAIGHLITLLEPGDYDNKYKKWNFRELPVIPEAMKLKPIIQTKRQFDVIKALMDDSVVDSLICATDSGREGELIFRYIYEASGCNKPFERLWISSMTEEAVKKGFENLKPGTEYDRLYESAKCRSEADWLVGINASRAFTIQYYALLSVGRVQTPTLALIVNRQEEIDNFVPQPYWEIESHYEDFFGIWFDPETKETKIDKKEEALRIISEIEGKTFTVESISKEKKKQVAPLLYDLTELQRDANKKFGLSAQLTLGIAQDLYEKHKIITYPRTDSRYLSDDMVDTVKATMKAISVDPYKKYASELLEKGLKFNKRIINNKKITDHHAIIPTLKQPRPERLKEQERNIFNLIVKRFLAVFYPDYRYAVTKIVTAVGEHRFSARGKTLIDWGWMIFYKSDQRSSKKDQDLPDVKKGDAGTVLKNELTEKSTTPPKSYTEATLLSAMENAGRFVEDEELREQLKESGLGTPATRAGIIERLINVKYISRKGKSVIPTEKAKKLISILPEQLKSPELTGNWEKQLTLISKGEREADGFMDEIKDYVKSIISSAEKKKDIVFKEAEERKNARKINPDETFGKCPACEKGYVIENSKSYFCSEWRNNCRFSVWKSKLSGFKIEKTEKIIKDLLEKKQVNHTAVFLGNSPKFANLILTKTGNILLRDVVDRQE